MRTRRIVFTGGGSGGHVYPLVAVLEFLRAKDQNAEIVYIGPKSSFNKEFNERGIREYHIVSSKLRRYLDIQNILDIPKFFIGFFQSLIYLYIVMPDIVFSKGGPGAFGVVLAARFYFIPVIIHESDAVPGLTNRLSARFASRILLSFAGSSKFFPTKKTALTGNPIRKEVLAGFIDMKTAREKIGINPGGKLMLILGGSQGSTRINNFVFDNLALFIEVGEVFHVVGEKNMKDAETARDVFIKENNEESANKYYITPYVNGEEMGTALSAADIVISRAGSGAIFEIAASGKPSMIVPLKESANDHQRENAYAYEASGASIVIEESNLSPNLIITEMKALLGDEKRIKEMYAAAKNFFKPDAGEVIASEILSLMK